MAKTPKEITVDVEEAKVEDWFHEELPDLDLSDEAIAANMQDLQGFITEEYGTIALLDDIIMDFEALRNSKKTQVDIMTKLAHTMERLQKEINGEE